MLKKHKVITIYKNQSQLFPNRNHANRQCNNKFNNEIKVELNLKLVLWLNCENK